MGAKDEAGGQLVLVSGVVCGGMLAVGLTGGLGFSSGFDAKVV